MLINFNKKGQVALLVTVLLTIAAIFFQSALNPSKSQEESSAVGGVIEDIVDVVVKPSQPNESKPDTPVDDAEKPSDEPISSDKSDDDLIESDSKEELPVDDNSFKINMPKLRKAAHFIEHGILGIEMFFLVMIIEKNRGSSGKAALRPISLLLTLYFLHRLLHHGGYCGKDLRTCSHRLYPHADGRRLRPYHRRYHGREPPEDGYPPQSM